MQLVGSVFLASCVLWVAAVLSHVLQIDSINPPFRPTLALHSFWSALATAAADDPAVAVVLFEGNSTCLCLPAFSNFCLSLLVCICGSISY